MEFGIGSWSLGAAKQIRPNHDEGAAQVPVERGAAPIGRKVSAGFLLFWQHCIFHSFANTKLQSGLGRDLNCCAGSRVPTLTSLSFGLDELAESRKNEFAVSLHFTCSEIT